MASTEARLRTHVALIGAAGAGVAVAVVVAGKLIGGVAEAVAVPTAAVAVTVTIGLVVSQVVEWSRMMAARRRHPSTPYGGRTRAPKRSGRCSMCGTTQTKTSDVWVCAECDLSPIT